MFKYNTILKPILKPQLRNGKLYKEETKYEIDEGVYIGNAKDYEYNKDKKEEYNFINACKYPYYEEYIKRVGNSGNGYLYGYNGDRLICNLVDSDDSSYIPREIIDECVDFIERSRKMGKKVLVNCNEGASRSATIGLIYLMKHKKIDGDTFEEVENKYKEIMPRYCPRNGMRMRAIEYYKEYYKSMI